VGINTIDYLYIGDACRHLIISLKHHLILLDVTRPFIKRYVDDRQSKSISNDPYSSMKLEEMSQNHSSTSLSLD
jgi:hypothetical protein